MITDYLKKKIKSTPQLECLYMCFKAQKDAALAKKIVGVLRDPYTLKMYRFGDLLPTQNIYHININEGYNFNGFCSLFRFTLCHLAFSEDINMVPVVYWGDKTLYYDKTFVNTSNVFEYFFEPVSSVSYKDIQKCSHVVESKGSDANAFGTTGGYSIPEDEIKFLSEYVFKYIKLKSDVENFINKEFYTGVKTLGVHVRATDFNKGYNRHPKVVTPTEYLEHAKKAYYEEKFEKVFLATDDQNVIELFANEFGDNLRFYNDTFRSSNGEAIHYGPQVSNREHHKYFLGLEILRDFYTLGRCDGLIAGNSNVSMCARIIKESTQNQYSYIEIIDKGVNHNFRETRSRFNPMIKDGDSNK